MDAEREMTFGEKAVGLRFNPSGDDKVTRVKKLYAEIIDLLDEERKFDSSDKDPRVNEHLSVAIIDAETAQMRAVKGLTFGK